MVMALLLAAVLPGFTLAKSTARADYYVDSATPGLRVDAAGCDAFVAQLERDLGVTVPHFTYYRVKDWDGVSRELHIPAASGGADTQAMLIVSMEKCHQHEIVHLATAQLGHPGKIFEEGIATTLGQGYAGWERRIACRRAQQARLHYESVEALFEQDVASTTAYRDQYRLSQAWTMYLIKEHGLSVLMRFFRFRAMVTTDQEAFESAYGVDLNTAFDQWLYGSKGPSRK